MGKRLFISMLFLAMASYFFQQRSIVSGVQRRLQQAERIWQESVTCRQNMTYALNKSEPISTTITAKALSEDWFRHFSFWDIFTASYTCPHEMQRVGRPGDGGKWVCGMEKYTTSSKPCLVYSFGVGGESSFESEFLRRTNCQIFGYDYSVSEFGPEVDSQNSARVHFFQVGLGHLSNTSMSPPFHTLKELMALNGHDHINILKIDIEGAEFDSLLKFMDDFQGQDLPVEQICLEVHLFKELNLTFTFFWDWWEQLELRGLRPVWTEPNVGFGILEDRTLYASEYTFINVRNGKSLLTN